MRAGGLRVLSDLTAGTSSLNTSAVLEAASSGRGFLPPRMTTVQRDAIVSPVEGLFIYNTVTDAINYYDGTQWVEVGTGDFWRIRDNLGGTFVRVAAGPTSPDNSIVGQIGSPVGYDPNQTVLQIDSSATYIASLNAANGSDNNAPNITVVAGNADLTSLNPLFGGNISFLTGQGTASGGGFNVTTGSSNTGGTSGNVGLSTGNNTGNIANQSGTVSIQTGNSGASGDISVFTGAATGSSGDIGITSGNAANIAGSIVLTAGTSSANTGGGISLNAGDSASGFNGPNISLTAGDTPNQTGGNIVLTPGTSGLSTNGSVVIGLASSAPARLRFLGSVGTGVNLIANSVTNDYTLTLPVVDGTNGYFLQYTTGGQLQWAPGSGGSYSTTFTNGDLVAGVLTVTHSLNQRPVNVQIYTDIFSQIIPDSIVLNTVNTAQIDLSSFTPLTGTWSVIVNP